MAMRMVSTEAKRPYRAPAVKSQDVRAPLLMVCSPSPGCCATTGQDFCSVTSSCIPSGGDCPP